MPKFPITDLVSIYKQKRTGNTEQYSDVPDYENVNCVISPSGIDILSSEGGVASYSPFQIFIYDITVQINNGDKIVSGNVSYFVTGSPNLLNNQYIQCWSLLAKQVI